MQAHHNKLMDLEIFQKGKKKYLKIYLSHTGKGCFVTKLLKEDEEKKLLSTGAFVQSVDQPGNYSTAFHYAAY